VTQSWGQAFVHFDSSDDAERVAVTELAPLLAEAEADGLISSWFFIRKNPCWRLSFLPSGGDVATRESTEFVHQGLNKLHEDGQIARWVETIYEPESFAFGGSAAMDTAHRLFHQDSHHVLKYLGSERATTSSGGDQRRELSVLFCGILMRSAGQDWYEQGDIWARVADHRHLPSDVPPDRLRGMELNLRRLMTVDTVNLIRDNGSLAFLVDWATAFDNTGKELANLALNGVLQRGLRAVLAQHVIFAWNRLGLPHATQSLLSNAAKAVVFDQ
jgi:thiopeptide-type bacteriocin biosynthesis protein